MSRLDQLQALVRDRLAQSGIDNYSLTGDRLLIGGTRYAVSRCRCGAPDCDGLGLDPIAVALPPAAMIASADVNPARGGIV